MKPQQYYKNMKFFCIENKKSIVDCGFKDTEICPQTCYFSQNYKPYFEKNKPFKNEEN